MRMLFDRHVANDWKARARLKRGGTSTKLDFDSAEKELAYDTAQALDPEEYFEREWSRSVFAAAVERLRRWSVENGKQPHFDAFTAYDIDGDASYRSIARRLGIAETSVTNYLALMRRRFRAIVLDVIAEVTASEHEYRIEVRALLGKDAE